MIKNIFSLPDLKLLKADMLLKKSLLSPASTTPSKAAPDTLTGMQSQTTQVNAQKQTPSTNIHSQTTQVNTQKQTPLTNSQTRDSKLSALSNSALQFFAKNQPFEGFTKLASALFPNIKNSADHAKEGVISKQMEQTHSDALVADKTTMKNLFMSAALKSDKADVNFLPQLLQKSGILMEKKLSDMVKNALSSSQKSGVQKSATSASDIPQNRILKANSPLTSNNSLTSNSSLIPDSSTVQDKSPLPNPANLVQEDIKGAVLNFIASSAFEASEPLSVQDVHVFTEFIKNLENVQLLNSHLSESGKYIIPFPMFSNDQFSFGQMMIDLGQKDKDNGSPRENSLLRVSLFLEMTNLGPVRADFSVLKDNITGGFQVSDEETANFFKFMLPELKERLQTHGYNVHRVECRVVEPEKLSEKSIINELLKSEEHQFSVMI